MKSLWLAVFICSAMFAKAEVSKKHLTIYLEPIQIVANTSDSLLEEKVDKLMDEQTRLAEKIDQLMNVIVDESRCPKNADDGVYQLKPSHSPAFLAYCEKGWIVIQRRINGRLSFNRNWNEYRDGFGDIRDEYWLGLERMYHITRTGSYELMVVLKSFDGVEKWAKFNGFKIASEIEQYRMDFESFSGGDAGNSLVLHNGMKFSTPDRENDNDISRNCGQTFKSGWWFNECYESNLNGVHTIQEMGIEWSFFTSDSNNKPIWKSLNQTRMMIRAI